MTDDLRTANRAFYDAFEARHLDAMSALQGGATVAALNVFVRDAAGRGDGWRLVAHHGSAVSAPAVDVQ